MRLKRIANFYIGTIQLKANYNRIRKNMIIKNIDYRKANDAIERGGPVHLFIR